MRLPNSLALATVADTLDRLRPNLPWDSATELESISDAWTMRKAWPSLKPLTKQAIRDAHRTTSL